MAFIQSLEMYVMNENIVTCENSGNVDKCNGNIKIIINCENISAVKRQDSLLPYVQGAKLRY